MYTYIKTYISTSVNHMLWVYLVVVRIDWLCWGLTTRQPLWVILCRLPEKGRKKIEEMVEEMKERDREEWEQEWKWKKTEEIKHSPSTLTSCYKDSRPCPTVSQYQLDATMT